MDVKDEYLMCPQPRAVKVSLGKTLAERLNLPEEWVLGKVLPGRREGVALGVEGERKLDWCILVPYPEAPTLWRGDGIILLVHVGDVMEKVSIGQDSWLVKLHLKVASQRRKARRNEWREQLGRRCMEFRTGRFFGVKLSKPTSRSKFSL